MGWLNSPIVGDTIDSLFIIVVAGVILALLCGIIGDEINQFMLQQEEKKKLLKFKERKR